MNWASKKVQILQNFHKEVWCK